MIVLVLVGLKAMLAAALFVGAFHTHGGWQGACIGAACGVLAA